MNIPPLVSMIQQTMLSFIFFDILETGLWMPQMLNIDEDYDTSMNIFFNNNGYGSMHLSVNMGSTFLFLLIILAVYFIYGVLNIIQSIFKLYRTITETISYLDKYFTHSK